MVNEDLRFDDLMFTESDFVSIHLDPPDKLLVDVRNVQVVISRGAQVESPQVIPRCRLEFQGVSRSERRVHEYKGKSTENEFRPVLVQRDLDETPPKAGSQEFYLEGVMLLHPRAWIDWEIQAVCCEIFVTPDEAVPNDLEDQTK